MPKQVPNAETPEKPKLPYQADVYQLSPDGLPHSRAIDVPSPDIDEVLSLITYGYMEETASVHIRSREPGLSEPFLDVMRENGATSVRSFEEISYSGAISAFSAEMLARYLKQVHIRRSQLLVIHNPFDGLIELPPLDQPESLSLEEHEV